MIIPSSVRVGKIRYTVTQFPPDLRTAPGWRGATVYAFKDIRIAYGSAEKKYTPAQKSETFWHELTHAILYDMQSRLNHDENFVTEFSRRLNNAVHSAKF